MNTYTVRLWDTYSFFKQFVAVGGTPADAVRAAVRRRTVWPDAFPVWECFVPAGELYQCGGLSALVVEGGEP